MDNKTRAFIYAFLSRCFEKELDIKALEDLKKSVQLLELIGEDTRRWFESESLDKIVEEANVDYNTVFMINSQPVETLVLDSKAEILVGLQNPVMQFYFDHGYEVNMNQTHILAPDHLSIEMGFMQNLAFRNENRAAYNFLHKHLLEWVPPYMIGIKNLTQTPLYRDLTDFTVDYLLSDYEMLKTEFGHES
ncbi:TorD/DmsD family molecular chaperone [Nitrosophilus alvini]|uniref:TorD/DmsD family molecular chaperone n=1 Tax=Nitrosophilus alvini TaxID=2714855 RepID=UPI00190BC142|nr:molecular chaperone TorD family protein [Nitrosophilus alvini]